LALIFQSKEADRFYTIVILDYYLLLLNIALTIFGKIAYYIPRITLVVIVFVNCENKIKYFIEFASLAEFNKIAAFFDLTIVNFIKSHKT